MTGWPWWVWLLLAYGVVGAALAVWDTAAALRDPRLRSSPPPDVPVWLHVLVSAVAYTACGLWFALAWPLVFRGDIQCWLLHRRGCPERAPS